MALSSIIFYSLWVWICEKKTSDQLFIVDQYALKAQARWRTPTVACDGQPNDAWWYQGRWHPQSVIQALLQLHLHELLQVTLTNYDRDSDKGLFYSQDFLPGHALQDLYKSLSTKLTDVVWDPWCDHNCRNVHNCHNQPQLSQHQSQLSQKTTIVTIATTIVAIWSTIIVATATTIVAIFLENFLAL